MESSCSSEFKFKFKHPFTCMVSGPTQSGKTKFIQDLITHSDKMIEPSPDRVVWCYGAYTDGLTKLPDFVTVHKGIRDIDDFNVTENNLLVLDDLMSEVGNDENMQEIFTKGSHHRNLSVIFVVQNLFHKAKWMRNISLNTHYFVVFKNPRDSAQVKYLGAQLSPGKGNADFLWESYKLATRDPHGYLLLDLRQETSEKLRVLSHVLPTEKAEGGYCYLPKKSS